MLKDVSSKNFIAVPTFHKNSMILSTKSKPNEQIYVEKQNIDELISLLQEAKKQFR